MGSRAAWPRAHRKTEVGQALPLPRGFNPVGDLASGRAPAAESASLLAVQRFAQTLIALLRTLFDEIYRPGRARPARANGRLGSGRVQMGRHRDGGARQRYGPR